MKLLLRCQKTSYSKPSLTAVAFKVFIREFVKGDARPKLKSFALHCRSHTQKSGKFYPNMVGLED